VSEPRPPGLPDFKSPPVTEVVLSIQFAALPLFRSVHAGFYWNEIRSEYPVVSEQAPIPAVFETFGAMPMLSPHFQVQALSGPLPVRHWFETASGEHLIQLQPDRILHNWRQQTSDMEYPRYELLRTKFEGEISTFAAFVKREGLGELRPNQCEVTYINTIMLPGGENPHNQLARITPLWTGELSDTYLPAPEIVAVQTKYVLRKEGVPYGRAYITFTPAYRATDSIPVVQLEITIRGKPDEESIAAAFSLIDREREVVVRTFASVTTPAMHKEWGRTDAT
jgi:uncharacterized protein (TIGR04255 family)